MPAGSALDPGAIGRRVGRRADQRPRPGRTGRTGAVDPTSDSSRTSDSGRTVRLAGQPRQQRVGVRRRRGAADGERAGQGGQPGAARRGGQGGGQGGGAPAIDGDAAAELEVAGELWIDVASHQLVKLVLEGKSKLQMNSEMDRNGQVMGIESKSDDSFRYALAVQPAPEQAEAKK